MLAVGELLAEPQSTPQAGFAKRMLCYTVWQYEKQGLPVFPIGLLTYDTPKKPAEDADTIALPGLDVDRKSVV